MILIRDTRPEIRWRGHRGRVEHHAVDAEAHAHVGRGSGSKWMSEAPRRTASAITACTSFTTGASSADSRSSMTCALVLLVLDLWTDSRASPRLPDQRIDVLRRGHGTPHLVAGGHRDVVEREQVRGVGGRHERACAPPGRRSGWCGSGAPWRRRSGWRRPCPRRTRSGPRSRGRCARRAPARAGRELTMPASISAWPSGRPSRRPSSTTRSTSSRSAKPSWTITSPMRRLTPVRFVGGIRPGTGNGPAEAA